MNAALARSALERLAAAGVREFCLCAGARNFPLVAQLEKTEGARLFHFFEERSAAFFALGRIRESRRPVAVVMTSGTAVAECLPAVIEAHYQGLPLVVLSADRPRAYRGTGAPQSIEQVGIFSNYVERCWDLESPSEEFRLNEWNRHRPLHVNLCFAEPDPREPYEPLRIDVPDGPLAGSAPSARGRAVGPLSRPVAVIGPLGPEARPVIREFLESHDLPFVAEATAGLALSARAGERRILAPERTLARGFREGVFGSVLRLGGVPTLRFWRDLEEKLKSVPVLSFSEAGFSGLARESSSRPGFAGLDALRWESADVRSLLDADREAFRGLLSILEKYPRSEAALVRALARKVGKDPLYLGNSLPVREWDLAAADLEPGEVWANRGANGIDGQTSSFLGWTSGPGPAAWALLGDLTALYDLTAPWVSDQLAPRPRRIVILNNFGGQIFKPMFGKEIYLNRHRVGFRDWAAMWGWDHRSGSGPEVLEGPLSDRQVIELLPDERESEAMMKEWKST